MKKTLITAIVIAGAMALSSGAFADKGAVPGTLVKIDATTVVIKNAKGEEVTYAVNEHTKIRGGDTPVGASVEIYPSKDGKTAAMIELVKK